MTRFHWTSLLVISRAWVALSAPCSGVCVTQTSPNPIRDEFPADIVGTLNGTLVAWLVDFEYARSLVPAEYPLLVHAAKAKIPDLPDGKFPLFSDIVMNFDGGIGNFTLEPFHRIRANVPFVDRLNDNYTSFRLNLPIAISQSVIDSSAAGGLPLSNASAATFDPSCNGYAAVPGSNGKEIYKNAFLVNQTTPVFTSKFHEEIEPFGIAFFRNISNQPAFGAGLGAGICAQGISFYNTSLTTGDFAPVAIRGELNFNPPLLPTSKTFRDVYGYKLDVAFLERQFSNCSSLQGYSGTGSGDSG